MRNCLTDEGRSLGCAKEKCKLHAVREMRVGPSKPLCRERLQTATSCCGTMATVVNVVVKRAWGSQISMRVMLLNLIAAAVRRGGCWRGPRAAAMEKPPRNIRPEFHSDCTQRALSRHGKCSLKGQPYAPVRCRIVEIRDASGHNTSGDVGIVRAPCAIVVSCPHRRGDCIQQTPGEASPPLAEVPRILVQQRRKDCICP